MISPRSAAPLPAWPAGQGWGGNAPNVPFVGPSLGNPTVTMAWMRTRDSFTVRDYSLLETKYRCQVLISISLVNKKGNSLLFPLPCHTHCQFKREISTTGSEKQ